MSEYLNVEVPEGINVAQEHPLKEFFQLVLGITVVIGIAMFLLAELGEHAASELSFEQEQALLASVPSLLNQDGLSADGLASQQRLQAIADRLVRHMDMPPGMTVTVHYSAEDELNAMATLGGHIVVFQGLLDAVKDETALAMVIAHEIAHVRLRHPARALGRGFAVMLLLATMTGSGDGIMQGWANSVGTLTVLRYSREQEAEADEAAIAAVYAEYGSVDGAAGFFEKLSQEQGWLQPPELLSTHPGHEQRIERIRQFSLTHPDTHPRNRSTTP